MISIENENTFVDMILDRGINLLLGAGFSVLATNRNDEILSLGNNLSNEIIAEFDIPAFEGRDLQFICQSLKITKRGVLESFLRQKYNVMNYDPLYNVIPKLQIKNIVTTNIDNLIEKIYDHSDGKICEDTSLIGTTESDHIALFKLHGSVTYPFEVPLEFSMEDLSTCAKRKAELYSVIASRIHGRPTLFWGTNLKDPDIWLILSKDANVNNHIQSISHWWVVVLPDPCFDLDAELLRNKGFNIIRADTEQLLKYLNDLDITLGQKGKVSQGISELLGFVNENSFSYIKSLSHPVRPLSTFFQGVDPTWYDIFSMKLHTLSHFNEIVDLFRRNDRILISGSPGSGKTTLLMQLFISDEFTGEKFYFSSMIGPTAEKIVKMMPQSSTITIFLDNLSDNLEAFRVLNNCPNIRIITAERDYFYEQIKSRVNIRQESIVDISDLPDADIQNIFNSMKKPLQRFTGGKVSLFEIVYSTWNSVPLEVKIKEMLYQLGQYDQALVEFYVLLTYMRYTNSAASIDMLSAYDSASSIVDYRKYYSYVARISSLIDSDYVFDPEQDYFTVRSRIFSELSIKFIDAPLIAKVLTTFHKNVHRTRIFRYDIFKKRAFDADITTRAFPKIEDGKAFYEGVLKVNDYWRDVCYIKHQYALYLLRLGYISNAWEMIDDAYTLSNGKIFSIKNTHAIILFDMNIERLENDHSVAIETIMKSFEALDDCLINDSRKFYHFSIYSNNAKRLHEKLGDNISINYLKRALDHSTRIIESREYMSHENRKMIFKERNELQVILRGSVRQLD